MLCRACKELPATVQKRDRTTDIRAWRTRLYRIADQLCSRCADLLGRDIERRARNKESQLEKFGLAGTRWPLLGRKADRD